jgi:hypothetical protein
MQAPPWLAEPRGAPEPSLLPPASLGRLHARPPITLPPTTCALPSNQMSYDAGDQSTTGYDRVEAIRAYCSLFPCNRVLGGIQVPPEVGWRCGECVVEG